MAKNSKIEWTHHTFNPWRGCTKVSDGCKHCYAETLSARNHATLGIWGPKGSRPIAAESYWRQPLKWDRLAKQSGERKRVFCASLADVFEGRDTMPKDAWASVEDARARLFDLIEATPMLDWLLLTKRPENVLAMVPAGIGWQMGFPSNLWIGTSVEDQKTADERIPHLLCIPAKVRFLSCEPLLGPVDLTDIHRNDPNVGFNPLTGRMWGGIPGGEDWFPSQRIHWVIVGGESGKDARPMQPDWARSICGQCQAANVPFLFKQWGEWRDFPAHSLQDYGHIEGSTKFYRHGKKTAGRLLDGRTWDEYPEDRA